jgi:hypothetical protein
MSLYSCCLVAEPISDGTKPTPKIEFALDVGSNVGSRVLEIRSQMKREYPLNLSISLSGGKETNKDSPSNGE